MFARKTISEYKLSSSEKKNIDGAQIFWGKNFFCTCNSFSYEKQKFTTREILFCLYLTILYQFSREIHL